MVEMLVVGVMWYKKARKALIFAIGHTMLHTPRPVSPPSGPTAGYRFLLPTLPANEGTKACIVLHGDLDARPFRIEDFRAPLEELGVIRAVSGIGPYQMSHVWFVKLRTAEAKEALVWSGGLRSDRPREARGDPKAALGAV
ncbi:hypothetical protein HPB48_027021 [Haemaphysalis longicornis]|uniref:Uncharacterized protein n=1 Tax=Haemaphysalis longicornis TaxID=44386 RepID=A0A9J6HDB5_HAELO|nr:hypothetical protein HPB48_027021 [Haemaphysalis longicornis]